MTKQRRVVVTKKMLAEACFAAAKVSARIYHTRRLTKKEAFGEKHVREIVDAAIRAALRAQGGRR